ncbi:TRAP transporter small permease [Clostridium transplantifaecale]|uniref:TRAP transporter small permease n=1 Tax=Clostridium transplantifaecale TaxID=2479838 RepID=UPI001FAAD63E|nr:TRAP transporter small permease [Clostridium transplantifaecale]
MKKNSINFESVITTIVMLTMLTLVFLGVISRYVLHFSFSFTEELVCAMFVLLSTMGGALASKENSHYTLDLITGMMKPGMKTVFLIIDTGLTCVAAAVLMYTGITMVQSQMKIGSLSIALKIPNWVYGSFVPLGLAFILFRSIQFMVRVYKNTEEEEK